MTLTKSKASISETTKPKATASEPESELPTIKKK